MGIFSRALFRLKTKSRPNYRRARAPVLSRPPLSKNPLPRSLICCRRFLGTKSTSAHAKTGISAPCAVLSDESLISVLSKAWWWFPWLDCRFLLFGSSSKELGKVRSLPNRGPVEHEKDNVDYVLTQIVNRLRMKCFEHVTWYVLCFGCQKSRTWDLSKRSGRLLPERFSQKSGC